MTRAAAAALCAMIACASPQPAGTPPASFVNRVWVVAESPQIAKGELRVFLADGTLVMSSPNATPALGRWRAENGQLTITEEGRDYPVDVLELSATAFRIRVRGPGEPVTVLFKPAEVGPAPAVAVTTPDTTADARPIDLTGTKWRLDDLAGKGVVDRVQATLEFTGDGYVSGHGSCNQFRGPVTITGDSIAFGALVATRMFCGEGVSSQENAYMAALADAHRYEVKDSLLYLYAAGLPSPLRFIRE